MMYQHNGEAVDRLLGFYNADKEPFVTNPNLRFQERRDGFEEIKLLKELFFPNYWNCGSITKNKKELEDKINELGGLFFDGIKAHILSEPLQYNLSEENIPFMVHKILEELADVREKLKKDIEATYKGDPAAKTYTEIIRAYPGFKAIETQRVTHILYSLGVLSYARELQENIHSITGIDIHPGAKIGEYFFIDHGSGVVIGETAEIGDWVRIYQNVTLGVLHFEKDNGDVLRKGYKRHPTVGNHVVIGAGAKVLGPVTIGDHVNIGANSWITEDIPAYTTVHIAEHPKLEKRVRSDKYAIRREG